MWRALGLPLYVPVLIFGAGAVKAVIEGGVAGPALAVSPPDYQMGDSYRILYVHVPSAILAQSVFIAMALSSAVFLVWKIKVADMAASVMAPFGAAMTFLGLFSGSLWGVPTWGTWDARLTSMLIQLFLYIGVIALRGAMAGYQDARSGQALRKVIAVAQQRLAATRETTGSASTPR